MIRVALTTHPRGGTIQIGDTTHALATWHRAGDGLLLGTTTDGQRVTLATEEADLEGYIAGSLCIGNTVDAPRWTIRNAIKTGAVLEGMAFVVPSDGWMATAFPNCGWEAK